MIGLIIQGVGQISKAVNHSKTRKNAAKDKDDESIVNEYGLLEGWLSKRGSDKSSKTTRAFTWNARYFRQTPDRFFLAYVTQHADTDESKQPKGLIDLRLCSIHDRDEPDRFIISMPSFESNGNDSSSSYSSGYLQYNYSAVGERRYEIRAPSKELAAIWKAEIQKRMKPTRFFWRTDELYDQYIAWLATPEAAQGKPIPEEQYKAAFQKSMPRDSYMTEFEYYGNKRSPGVFYFRDGIGCIWDSRGKYYPTEYYAIYGIAPPAGMDKAVQLEFKNRPYQRPLFEPQGHHETGDCLDLFLPAYGYADDTIEDWYRSYEWPLDRAQRKYLKQVRGVPLDPNDLTPPPTPPESDHENDNNDADYGGYGDDDDNYSTPSYDYDTGDTGNYSTSNNNTYSSSFSSTAMSPEERRQKELEQKVAQWERQCKQIEAANDKMKDTYERQMKDYERKHREWESTTKEKCKSCNGKSYKECTQCRGAGRKDGRECLTCRGKAKFDCLHCHSHKGLDYGPKGKYAEPKPPSKPKLKDLPRRPT